MIYGDDGNWWSKRKTVGIMRKSSVVAAESDIFRHFQLGCFFFQPRSLLVNFQKTADRSRTRANS